MNTSKDVTYHSIDDYGMAIETLHLSATMIVFSFAKHSNETRDVIIRNFVARGMTCLESIYQVWRLENYQDSWILHRSLLDRLFHLRYLMDCNGFETFDDWSFIKQFEAKSNILSDQEMRSKVDNEIYRINDEERKRYSRLKKQNVSWSRPKAEQVAKKMNLSFLYKYGYDYASMHVHPMANDGEEDYLRLTGLLKESRFDQRVILHNSILVQILLVQEALNASLLVWRRAIYNLIDDYMSFLESGSLQYQKTFMAIVSQGPDFDWCQTVP